LTDEPYIDPFIILLK